MMRTTTISAILVLALASVASAAPFTYLTINGEALDTITLKTGQVCTVGVVSTTSTPYEANVGFDDRVVLGIFDQPRVTRLAGDQASITEVDKTTFYGYRCIAEGYLMTPSPGVHFTIKYRPNQVGETDIKLYSYGLSTLIDSIHVTIVPGDMGTAFTYQGRMMEDGNPADGLHDFQFSLYNDANTLIGNQVGNTIDINDLDVIDGYFTVELDFNSPSAFNGYARWLQIDVRPGDSNDVSDYVALSPRQEVTPVPYALFALDSPSGAGVWTADGNDIYNTNTGNVGIGTTTPRASLEVTNTGSSHAIWASTSYIPVYAHRTSTGGTWPAVAGDCNSEASSASGVRGRILSTTPGSLGAGVYGYNYGTGSNGVGVRGHHAGSGYAGYFTGGKNYFQGNVGIDETSPLTKLHVQGTDRTLPVVALWGDEIIAEDYTATLGLYSDDRASHGSCITLGEFEDATATLKNKWGIYRMTGPSSALQFSFGTERNFTANPTLLTITAGGNVGIGIINPTAKLDVKSPGTGEDVISAHSSTGSEMFLVTEDGLGNGKVFVRNASGETKVQLATYGYSLFKGGNVGIGDVGVPLEKLVVRGNILVKSESTGSDVLELGEGLDYAEGFDVTEEADIESGTVLVIDSDNPGKLTVSSSPYDSKVAGIVAGAKGIGSGVRLGVGQFDYDVALAGRVFCNVDATEAAVQAGDLLTTSAVPGYAMKATDYDRARGAILGKAMESLEKGQKGQILVLVTLQ